MSDLNSEFDVVRGWPNDTCIEESFKPSSNVPANNVLDQGDVVKVVSDSGDTRVERASGADYDGAADLDAVIKRMTERDTLWMVVDGSSAKDYDALKQRASGGSLDWVPWKVTCIKGTYMVETENYNSNQTFNPGESVTVVNGTVEVVSSNRNTNLGHEKFGEVVEHDNNKGVLTIMVEQ